MIITVSAAEGQRNRNQSTIKGEITTLTKVYSFRYLDLKQ